MSCEAITWNRVIDGVHIWRAALDGAGWPGPERLPAPERERAATFLREDARRRWLASRWALRRVLATYLEVPAEAVEIEEGDRSKPRLRGDGPLRFNLSHSGGLALIAVTEGREVGVDLELVEPGRDLVALAERALGADAAAVRDASPADRPARFYAAWTHHEAQLKCLGVGLAGASLRSSTSEVQDRSLVTVADLPLFLCPAMPGKGTAEHAYAAAVAVADRALGPLGCRTLRPG
ncbi:MAG: 4'-phosphopantetheinyl transferase family protein [Nitrososphaerota archaeon]